MNHYILTEDERRIICKQALESLEFWLRRLIHDTLSTDFGDDYLSATLNGRNIINNNIRGKIQERKNKEPERFPRLIDASLLEHQIDIICNPDLYNSFFKEPFKLAFPNGREVTKTFLERLVYPRNCLYHANPISVRMSEQVVCYTNDVIDSLKSYYRMIQKEQEFNVPKIIKAIDSFGNVFHFNTSQDNGIFLHEKPEFYLYPGDTLTIEIEVDPTFDESEYSVSWYGPNMSCQNKKMVLRIDESFVSIGYQIECHLISNKTWHKYSTFDDKFYIIYKILPPL
ncbi:hypothetical protein EGI26_08260 [Lacihabitans sp. CCS-44]|uniref:hypothetical protein n=1 Tax=Lacihabitans sp. CCS-44 TaxID=2487331 RepID=UPI0020CD0A4B|nr:hypothetical protein [Lacihabitans sp. CCS-44]MCP9755143.1 hypothetical protein [Lacihabitans sp. CCS-44]